MIIKFVIKARRQRTKALSDLAVGMGINNSWQLEPVLKGQPHSAVLLGDRDSLDQSHRLDVSPISYKDPARPKATKKYLHPSRILGKLALKFNKCKISLLQGSWQSTSGRNNCLIRLNRLMFSNKTFTSRDLWTQSKGKWSANLKSNSYWRPRSKNRRRQRMWVRPCWGTDKPNWLPSCTCKTS